MTAVNPGPAGSLNRNTISALVRVNGNAGVPFGGFAPFTSTINALSGVARWFQLGNVPFSYFSTNTTVNTLPLLWLPGGGVIEGIFIYPIVPFGGGGSSSYTLSVGLSTNTTLLASAFTVSSAFSSASFQLSSNFYAADIVNTTQITITATSVGANLNAVTTGMANIKVKMSSLVGD